MSTLEYTVNAGPLLFGFVAQDFVSCQPSVCHECALLQRESSTCSQCLRGSFCYCRRRCSDGFLLQGCRTITSLLRVSRHGLRSSSDQEDRALSHTWPRKCSAPLGNGKRMCFPGCTFSSQRGISCHQEGETVDGLMQGIH